jgi:Protein of unknown function (DUF3343)
MPRLLLTFRTLRLVLGANKALRDSNRAFQCRVTPMPAQLESSVCGMAVEILDRTQVDSAVKFLSESDLSPTGIHELPD